MEFFSWELLATFAGASAFVLLITQFTKGMAFIDRMPTQVWSWLIALATLYPAYYFTDQLTVANIVLIPFNAFGVSLASNGGFEALAKMFPNLFSKTI